MFRFLQQLIIMGSILSFVYLYFFPRRQIKQNKLGYQSSSQGQTKSEIACNNRKIQNQQTTKMQKQQKSKQPLNLSKQQQNTQSSKPRSKLYPIDQSKNPQYVISLHQLQGDINKQNEANQTKRQLLIKPNNQQSIHHQNQHYLLKIDKLIKEEVYNSMTLIWIKQGILDFHQKFIERYKSIFNLKIFQSLEDLIFNLQNIQSFTNAPTRIICHHSIFTKVHNHFANNSRVLSISIFNTELIDHQLSLEQTKKQLERQKQFINQREGMYHKLGKISDQIIQMREQMINQTISQGQKNCVVFQQYLFYNKQYIDNRSVSLKSALLLQKGNSLAEKEKAKEDLVKLVTLIFDNQIYLQYFTQLNRKSNSGNNLTQNKKSLSTYVQDILNVFKSYPTQLIYQNIFAIDKQKIYLLEELQELKARPITEEIVLWQILQFFLFKQNLAINVIKQYVHRNKSPLQICYARLMISDMSICIKQLYNLHDQKKVVCQCYYTAFASQDLIKNIKSSISKTMQLQQFMLCNLNKPQQMHKPGNVFFMISVNDNQRQLQADHGFIKFEQFIHLCNKKQYQKGQYKNKILFNILSHFYVQSITFDAICDKLIVKLTYGYTPTILKRYNQDRISLTKQEIIHVYYWTNNEQISNIKDQGQALRLLNMHQYSLAFYQQALIKAKKQAEINHEKIAKIHYNTGKTLHQKQVLNRSVQYFNYSMSQKQKIFGQKCLQSLEDYEEQAVIYSEQEQLQRSVRTYEIMLTLVNRSLKQQGSQYSPYLQKKVLYEFLIGKNYQKMMKHQLAEKQYLKTISMAIELIGQFQILTAQIYISLGDLYVKIDLFSKATFNYKKALVIRLNIFGQYHILTAESYKKIGDSTDKDLQYEHSYRHYHSAFQIYSKFYQRNHDQILFGYKNLGKALFKKNYFDDAIHDFKEALQVTIKKYGTQNLRTGQLYYFIGECYKKKGDYLSAIQMFQKNKSLSLKILSPNHPETNKCYREIGQVYQKQGKYNEAIEYYEKPLMNLIKNKGQYHRDTVEYYEKLGHLYMKRSQEQNQETKDQKQLKKYQIKAISYLKKILDIRFQFKKNSLETAKAYDSLGRAHLIKKDYKNAQGYFQQSISIKKLLLKDQNDINYAVSYCNFGETNILEENFDISLQNFQKALRIKLQKLGQNHPQISQIYKNMAFCYLKKTQYKKSEQGYRKSLAIKLSIYGSYNPQTALSHFQLGNLYQNKRQFQKALQMLAKAIQTMKNLKLTDHQYYKMFCLKFIEIIKLISNNQNIKQLRHAFYYLNNLDPSQQMIRILKEKIIKLQNLQESSQKDKKLFEQHEV